jgi:hypothetical protein
MGQDNMGLGSPWPHVNLAPNLHEGEGGSKLISFEPNSTRRAMGVGRMNIGHADASSQFIVFVFNEIGGVMFS